MAQQLAGMMKKMDPSLRDSASSHGGGFTQPRDRLFLPSLYRCCPTNEEQHGDSLFLALNFHQNHGN